MIPKVSIIMLNWNGWQDTIECLESLYQITYPNYDVIVVDNGSEDDSIVRIKEYAEGKIKVESKFFEYSSENKPIRIIDYTREEAEGGGGKEKEIANLPSNRKLIIIKNEKNYGFAEGNNIAMRYALKALNPDYILLLNNDTVVDKLFLGKLVEVAESDEKIGAVGPQIYYYSKPNTIMPPGGYFNIWIGKPSLLMQGSGGYNKTQDVDYIHGTSILIKVKTFKEVGLLDKDYFAFVEDLDWCYRAKRAGYRILFVPTASIWHKVAASIKDDPSISLYYFTRNMILFMRKNATFLQIITFLAITPYYFIDYLFKNIQNGKKIKNIIKGIFWHLYKR